MSEMTVREATPDDPEDVRRVARAAWHAAYDELLGAGEVDDTVDSWYDPARIAADVDSDRRPFFVARDDSLAGFAVATPHEAEATYSLYRLYVHPDRWGEGIGTSLLERTQERLRERGIERLRLSVVAANDVAVSFYESRGFERVATATDENYDLTRYVYAKELPDGDESR